MAIKYIAISATKFIHHDPKMMDIFEYDGNTKLRKLTDAVTNKEKI